MPDYDASAFKINPGAVSFGDTGLGGTSGPVTITPDAEYLDSTCNQAGNQVLARRLLRINYTISAEFKEVAKILPLLTDVNGDVTLDDIGQDEFANAKELRIAEIGGDTVHVFPKAIIQRDYSYPISGTEEHAISLNFYAIPDATGLIYSVEAISAG